MYYNSMDDSQTEYIESDRVVELLSSLYSKYIGEGLMREANAVHAVRNEIARMISQNR